VTAVENRPQQFTGAGHVRLIDLRTADEYEADKKPKRRFPRGLERLLGVVLLLALWQVAASAGWIGSDVLAGPADVASTVWTMLTDGTLTAAIWASLQRVVIGMVIGIPIGVLLALFSGLSRVGEDLTDSTMHMLRFVPIIALQPLIIIWLGIGESAKISMIVLGTIFPIYVNTANGTWSSPAPWGSPGGRRSAGWCSPPPCRRSSWGCGWPPASPGCCSCSPSRSTPRAASAT
jgi:hypothetical protein